MVFHPDARKTIDKIPMPMMSIGSLSFLQAIHCRCKLELIGDDGHVL